MKKKKRLTPLSHREFKRNFDPQILVDPKKMIIRQKAEELAERIKKEKEW